MTPKENDIVIAIDECRMEDTNKPTLTIGKEYKIIRGISHWFRIIDDEGDEHEFNADWIYYFKLKQKDSIVESVITQFKARSERGIDKYGVTLDRTDLSTLEWIKHAQEEAMDFCLYLERLKQEFINQKQK